MEKTLNESQEWGEKFFRLREYTPIPLIMLLLLVAQPTVISVTLGMLSIFLGELIRLHSAAFMGGIARTRSTALSSNLINDGPFAIVRNPFYVGNFFLVLGFATYSGRFWLVALSVIFFAIQYRLIVDYEEVLLEEKFGNDYIVYRNQVPAWLPRKLPDLNAWIWPASYSDAIRSERRTLTAIGLILTLLLILSPH